MINLKNESTSMNKTTCRMPLPSAWKYFSLRHPDFPVDLEPAAATAATTARFHKVAELLQGSER